MLTVQGENKKSGMLLAPFLKITMLENSPLVTPQEKRRGVKSKSTRIPSTPPPSGYFPQTPTLMLVGKEGQISAIRKDRCQYRKKILRHIHKKK